MKFILAWTIALAFGLHAFAAGPTLFFKNQFGEQTNATIITPTSFIGGTIAGGTIVSNIGTIGAAPIANTYAAVSAKMTPSMLLTGWTLGTPAVVLATDTVIQGMQKIASNTAAAQADTVAVDLAALKVDFNLLLAKLRAAKLMAP